MYVQGGGQSAAELERVVNAMRRVIERLQSENTSLKNRVKVGGTKSTTLTALEKENTRLKVHVVYNQRRYDMIPQLGLITCVITCLI